MAVELRKFPNDIERDRIAVIGDYRKLSEDNEQFAVLGVHDVIRKQYKDAKSLIYLAHAIPARISEFYGDFVQGDVDKLIIAPKKSDNQDLVDFVKQVVYENDLKERISDIGEEQSEFGYVVLLGRLDNDGNFIIDIVPPDQYFPQPDGSVIFATYKRDPDDITGKRLLLYTQHYQMVNGKCQIERQAFKTDERGVASEEYSLSAMSQILGREIKPLEVIDIDELPIRQIDNGRKTKYGFGKSDYADIMPQLAEINERATHISTQLLKNLDAKMALPQSLFVDGVLPQGDAYAIGSKDDIIPQYISNTNTLIADVREHIIFELKIISFVTGVPMFHLLGTAQPERVESLKIQLFSALRKTTKKRAKIKRALLDMFRIGAKLKNIPLDDDIIISFSSPLPEDELVEAQVEQIKVQAGISSRVSAMERLENYSEEEAINELKRIANEDRITGVVDTTTPPSF